MQTFNFEMTSGFFDSGGSCLNTSQSICLPCKNAERTSILLHFHPLDTIIEEVNLRDSLLQVGESTCNISRCHHSYLNHFLSIYILFCKDPSHGYIFLGTVRNFLVNMVSFPIFQLSQFSIIN